MPPMVNEEASAVVQEPAKADASTEASEQVAAADTDIAATVWTEIARLRDEIPPPDSETKLYPDARAADAFQAADQAVASLCTVPRGKMLEGFTRLVEGRRLGDLLDALVASDQHPALQHSCLMVMCGVASLKQAHDVVAQRRDVLKSLLGALAEPKAHRISPQGAEENLDVNPAVGAAICLNSLLVSCGGLTPDAIKTWVELDALAAITSALEAHSVFEGGGDEDVLPAMLFGLATPLLIRDKETRTAAAAAAAAKEAVATATKKAKDGEEAATTTTSSSTSSSSSTTTTAPASADAEQSAAEYENFKAGRQRLAEAFLGLLAERREWVARSLAMAANASPTDISGGAVQTPAPVTINNLLVNSLAHPDLLGHFTGRAPVRLRAKAVASARQCEADGTFAKGFAQQFARLLGLGTQQENQRRLAGMTMDNINRKQTSDVAVIRCAKPSCGKRQVSEKFKMCSRCQSVYYCSGECQTAHWKNGHKRSCKKQ